MRTVDAETWALRLRLVVRTATRDVLVAVALVQ